MFLQALGHGREGRERQSSRDDCTDYRNGLCCSLSETLFRHAEVEVGGDLFRVKRQKVCAKPRISTPLAAQTPK